MKKKKERMWKCEGRCEGGESGDSGLILLVDKGYLNERGAGPIGKVLVYAEKKSGKMRLFSENQWVFLFIFI